MNTQIFSANLRQQNAEAKKQAYIKSVDDLLFEATMEAVYGKEPGKKEPGR